ncbi:MAG TPA: ATP-dependent DNA helicase [Candidatus Lokiarchaeia archaeon]|nr:ATP-dependent DNA helicase [Candidatus Lokiarchaeia archaeon]
MLGPKDFFPYPAYRNEQEEFILNSNEILSAGKHVIVSAPNGFGKTISVLSAALPVALENDLKIVYCCRTHVQNSRVIEELDAIHQHLLERGLVEDKDTIASEFTGVSLRGRSEMCFKDQIRENELSPGDASAVCSQLRKDGKCVYFKNFQKLTSENKEPASILHKFAVDSDEIINACNEKKLCPYFFSRALLKGAKVAVCNYNWFFNPSIQENFLESIDAAIEDILLIIDEAHNLPPLSEEIHSLKIGKFTINNARKELQDYFPSRQDTRQIDQFLKMTEDLFDDYERKVNTQDEMEIDAREIVDGLKASIGMNLAQVLKDLDEKGDQIQKEKLETGRKNPRSFCKAVARFWTEWQYSTLDKAAYYHCFSTEKARYSFNHFFEAVCLDPGLVGIKSILDNVYASISLSGTIIPEAYSAICRVPDPTFMKMHSPFDESQVKSVILEGVSTGIESRNQEMYKKYLRKIVEMAQATPKNSAAFCASYSVLKGIKDAGFENAMRQIDKIPVVEKEGMKSSENDELINQYKEYSRISSGAVLLGVTGGRNSEGEDFPHGEMNAVMVIGVPYATPTPRIRKKIEYYNATFQENKGWLLAYEIPAVQKANQACGRPVRTLEDHGAIILADERFKKEKILRLLAPWILRNVCSIKDIPGHLYTSISRFFEKVKKDELSR